MLKLKKFMVLSLGMTALFGSVAFAESEEGAARRNERMMQQMASFPLEAPRTALANRPLVVYRHSSGGSLGLAAEVTEIARYKQFLFLYNGYGHGPQVVAYFTPEGADRDMKRVLSGESIDASRCMVHDSWIASSANKSGDLTCLDDKTFSLKMDCDASTMVPLMSGIHREWYQLTDIVASAPTVTESQCIHEHPGKI